VNQVTTGKVKRSLPGPGVLLKTEVGYCTGGTRAGLQREFTGL